MHATSKRGRTEAPVKLQSPFQQSAKNIMVTGIETAGLALAIFPLVVRGLAFYLDAAQKVKEIYKYEGVLKRLVRELEMERSKFENTCAVLLEGMVSAEQLATLVSGEGWKDPNLQNGLERCLGLNAAKSFTEAVAALNSLLDSLRKGIGLDENSQPMLLDRKHQKRQWKRIKLILDQRKHDAILNEINKINADLQALTMQRPRTTAYIPNTQSSVAKNYCRVRDHAMNLYRVLRRRFRDDDCHCRAPHIASLPLRITTVDEINQDFPSGLRLTVLFHFDSESVTENKSILPWDWRSLEFEPTECKPIECGDSTDQIHPAATDADLEEETQDDTRADLLMPQDPIKQSKVKGVLRRTVTKFAITAGLSRTRKKVLFAEPALPTPPRSTPPTTVNTVDNQIDDLCAALKKCSGKLTKACMGILGDECNGWHRIWPLSTPTYSHFRNVVTLDRLLQPGLIPQRARLELGVQLATAVVLLHRSEWLSENWGKRDICFPQKASLRYGEGGKRVPHQEPVMDQPFVRGNFEAAQSLQTAVLHSSHQNASQPFTTSALVPVEQSLFSLGIVLVELWFEHPIEELRIQHPQTSDFEITDSDNVDYQTAKQLIGELLTSAGFEYGLAVSHCIDGLNSSQGLNSGINSESKSLNDCEYKDAVHTTVICRLEKNLKAFTDGYL